MSPIIKVVLLVFREICNFIFPLTEDEKNIAGLTMQDFKNKLNVQTVGNTIALGSFKDYEMRAALHLIKFHGNKHATSLVAATLHAWLISKPTQEYILIPLPLSARRYRERGFNQAEHIAREATHCFAHITIRTDILRRTKHTAPQSSLKKEQRVKNVSNAFSVNSEKLASLTGKQVILFDDVVTTGATMHAAKATLLQHAPVPIMCVALAH